jgi:Ca-activated chloride channel family protein
MENLHFMYPSWLWLLLLIPLLWGLRAWVRPQNGAWERIVDKHLMPFVLSGQTGSTGRFPLAILSLALLAAVLAMAGPAWEKREVPVFHNQQALVVAMDFSASMYAEDTKPNRLTLERFKLLDILNARKDGQTGLVVFAGDAFVVSPLTDDTATIAEQARNLSPDIMPAPGSLLAPAIKRSVDLLKQAGVSKGHILLLTDGANDADEAETAAADARKQGYTVSVLAIGSEAGAPVPLPRGGFLTDGLGKTVVAGVNGKELKAVAEAGGGLYAQAGQGDNDLSGISAQWEADTSADLTDGQGRQIDTWLNEGFWVLPLLLPLAALAFRRGWLAAVLVCFVLPQPQQAYAFDWNDLWLTPDQQAQQAMQTGNAGEAAKLFENPEWKAAAAYKNKDYASAAQQYAGKSTVTDQYNYANAMAQQGKFADAIAAYEKVLKTDPKHEDARYNLDVVKKAQQQQQQGQNQQQADKQQQNQQQNPAQQNQQGQQGQEKQQQGQNADKQQAQDKQSEQNKQQDVQQKQADKQQEQQDKQGKGEKQDQNKQEKGKEDAEESAQQREQQQATEQWLRRIPDDPAGLWRRKFQYQYQQRGTQARGSEW